MYAVIATGGKQERVQVGERIAVERLGVALGEQVSFVPVLVVDGDNVVASPGDLAAASVTATVVGEAAGPKITGFTYRAKARGRVRFGHRQHYTTVEITEINPSGAKAPRARAKKA